MSLDIRSAEKRRNSYEMDDSEGFQETTRSASPPRMVKAEDEKRMRREIANSNERRRMQSINAGFSSLKMQIPHQDNEKLSKSAILHQASEYIRSLESDKNQLMTQISFLRKRLKELAPHEYSALSPPPKRKKRDTENMDEGISMHYDEQLVETRRQLQRERQQRQQAEDRIKHLEIQLQVTERNYSMRLASQLDDQMEVDRKPEVPAASHQVPRQEPEPQRMAVPQPAFTSPQSKRNLEMIVEAINHLEGEGGVFNSFRDSAPSDRFRSAHAGSEESQTESSPSDQEDSEGTGHSLPLRYSHQPPAAAVHIRAPQVPTVATGQVPTFQILSSPYIVMKTDVAS